MDTEKVFTAIFWTLFASMLLLRFWFAFRVWQTGERLRGDRAAVQREGFWARAIDRLFFLLLAALILYLLFNGGSLRRFAFPAPDWLRWVGVGLGITSVGLFAWTHAVLGRFWSPYLQLRPNHRLITHGPYTRIRHPIYSAILGWLISLGLVAANGTPFVFAAVGALHFLLRIQGEEKMMLEQFGDEYRAHMKQTGRLLPVSRGFLERNKRFVAVAAFICFVFDVALSHRIEPGVQVQRVTLAGDTPALKFIPNHIGCFRCHAFPFF